jgi:ribosomal protein RSM22 (predicted rRNA methylase)
VGTALDAGHRALADCRTLLDLGAGPGSALWAAVERLDLTAITAVERDAAMIHAGRRLAEHGPAPLPATTWMPGDLRALPALTAHDLVTVSYALGELAAADQERLVDAAWALTARTLVLVEPGTPRGAAVIDAARTRLIAAGAGIAAPCTHANACPLAGGGTAPGWCHATVRLPRSRAHRTAKSGSLGYEDEPYAFLVATRGPVRGGGARIVAPTCGCKHAIELTLCTPRGLEHRSISKRDRTAWQAARHARWGGWWEDGAGHGQE